MIPEAIRQNAWAETRREWIDDILYGTIMLISLVVMLAAWLVIAPVRFLRRPLWAMTAAFAFATMVKPAAGILFWIAIVVLLVFRLQPARELGKAALVYAVVMLGWAWCYWAWSPARAVPLYPQVNQQGFAAFLVQRPLTTLLGPPNSYLGYHFAMKLYRYRGYHDERQLGGRDLLLEHRPNLLAIGYSPATDTVFGGLSYFASRYPQHMGVPEACMAEFGYDHLRFLAWMRDPARHSPACSGSAMGWLWNWTLLLNGEERASDLLLGAALDAVWREPAARRLLLGDWLQSVVLTRVDAPADPAEVDAALSRTIASAIPNHLPAGLKPAVGIDAPRPRWAQVVNAGLETQQIWFRAAKPALLGLMLGGVLILLVRGPAGPFGAFLLLAYLGSATVWVVGMIMPESDPRHEAVFTILPLLAVPLALAGARCAR